MAVIRAVGIRSIGRLSGVCSTSEAILSGPELMMHKRGLAGDFPELGSTVALATDIMPEP